MEFFLLAESQPANQILVPSKVLPLQIVEEAPTLAYHLEKTTPGMVILLMTLQMVGQIADFLAEDCDLHVGGSSVGAVQLITIYNIVFSFSGQSHSFSLLHQDEAI